MKRITYKEHGIEFNFKRYGDTIETITLYNTWIPEGTSLLYGYKDRFNIITIPVENIINIEEL